MNNLFDQIEHYIDKTLVREELIQFEEALKTNEELRKEVEIYQSMIVALRIQEENQLRRKFAVMDVVLDKQLEEEDNNTYNPSVKENPEPEIVKVVTMPIYKTSWFRVAAAVLVVIAAYLITPPNTQTSSNSLALEQYEVEYKGWKSNNLQYSSPSQEHANSDNLGEGTANTAESNANDVKGTASINQYKEANDYFKQGDYQKSITLLKQIKDINSQRKNFRLGMAYYANQDLTKAIVRLKKTVEASDIQISTADLNTAKWNLGMAYAKQEKIKEAIPYFNELIQTNSNYSQKASELIQKMK